VTALEGVPHFWLPSNVCEWHSRKLLYVRQQIRFIAATNKHFVRKSLNINGIKMHNIKDEQETVSALCHRGNLTAANGQIPVYLGSLKPFSHGVSLRWTPLYVHGDISWIIGQFLTAKMSFSFNLPRPDSALKSDALHWLHSPMGFRSRKSPFIWIKLNISQLCHVAGGPRTRPTGRCRACRRKSPAHHWNEWYRVACTVTK